MDRWPAGFLQADEGELSEDRWLSGEGIYVTAMKMADDGTFSLYHPGDELTVACTDGSSRTYTVLAVVTIPEALRSSMTIDLGVEYVLPQRNFPDKRRRNTSSHENDVQCG